MDTKIVTFSSMISLSLFQFCAYINVCKDTVIDNSDYDNLTEGMAR